jgi:hypothetical protein
MIHRQNGPIKPFGVRGAKVSTAQNSREYLPEQAKATTGAQG